MVIVGVLDIRHALQSPDHEVGHRNWDAADGERIARALARKAHPGRIVAT